LQRNLLFHGEALGQLDEVRGRRARSCPGKRSPRRSSFVADQRVCAEQVDVVVDQHDVARGFHCGFIPPHALLTTSTSVPSARITPHRKR